MESNVIDLSTRRPRTPKKRRPSFLRLPFIKKQERGGGYDYWAVVSCGNWRADCQRGEDLGYMFLAYLAKSGPTVGDCTLLGCITKSIAEKGDKSGLATGFMGAIGGTLGYCISANPEIVDLSQKAAVSLRRDFREAMRSQPG